jgi:hypothetical protein
MNFRLSLEIDGCTLVLSLEVFMQSCLASLPHVDVVFSLILLKHGVLM